MTATIAAMKAVTRGITLLVSDGAEMLVDVAAVADRLTAMRGPGESYSDVILRLIELEAQSTT